MTLQKRLARIEAQRAPAREAVQVNYLCDPETNEPGGAVVIGQGTFAREASESAQDFVHRTAQGKKAIMVSKNGREALADPDLPKWARPEIIVRALKQKHGISDD